MSYSSEVVADSPLAYWKFDEVKVPATDTAAGASWFYEAGVTGQLSPLLSDGGYSVHGSGSAAIALAASVPSAINGANVTLEAWVSLPGTNVRGSFVKVGSSANGWGMGIGNTQWDNAGQKLILLSETVAWHPTTYTFPGAGTYHVVVVRGASGAVTAYVNGTSVWSGTLSSPVTASGQMGVGGYTESLGFKLSSSVTIDNVAIFPSALASGRVTAHYNSGSGDNSAVSADSPTCWLKLDDSDTTSSTGAGSTTADSSGNSRTLVHANSPAISQGSLLGDGSGYSITYNGSTQYSTIDHASWMATTSGLTVEARIRPTSGVLAAGGFIASRWNGGAGSNMWLFGVTSAGKLTASVVTGGTTKTVTGATTLSADTNYTVALRWTSGGNLEVFLNGVSDGSTSATGSIATVTAGIEVGRAALTSGSGLSWGGRVDDLSITGASLSDSRMVARHAAAVAAAMVPQSFTGTPASVTVTAPAGTFVAGTASTPADFTGTAVVVTVEAPLGDFATSTPQAQNFTGTPASVTVTSPAGSFYLTTASETIDTGIEFGSEVTGDGSIDLVLDSMLSGFGVGSEIVGDITVTIDRIDTDITIGSRLLDPRSRVADPRTTRPQVQLRVIDHDGVPSCDLAPRATIGTDVTDPLNEASEFDFTLPARDPGAALVTPTAGSRPPMVQLWRGSYLHKAGWYYVIKAVPSDDGAFLTFKCVDIRWPLEGNLIGKIPRRNLLSNGDFQSGDAGSVYGWDDGSTPAMYPLHQIVDDDFTDGGKALELIGADKSQLVVSSLSSAAVFVPNSSSYLSGGEAAVQDVGTDIPADSDVHIVGHTANDGTGDGMALSLARANAAKATLLAQEPSLNITTEGAGYYKPVASNATEVGRKQNRRVVISYQGVDDGTNSAQWESRSIRITNPTSAKRKLPVTVVGWFNLVQFTGPNKDNLAIRVTLAKAATPDVVIDEATVTLDEDTEIGAYAQASVTLDIPANSVEYILRAYYYAPHGTVRWTRRGFYPDDALTFYGTDQSLIVRALIEHAQDPAMGKTDWGIGHYTRATGVKRRRVYPYRDHREVADAIWNDFPTLDRGMDVDVYTSPWSRKIRTHFPRQGSTSETVLALGHNVIGYSAAVDLTQTATVVVAQSDDIGAFREEAHCRNTSGLGGLVLEKVISAERETPIDELDELARDGVKRFGRPVVDLRLECDPRATSDLLDELDKGDTVRVIIHDAGLDIDTLYRVVDYPWNPETDGLSVGLVLEV